MNLLPYRERDFYIGEFDSSVYQVLMLVENWKPGKAIIEPGNNNMLLYLRRLIRDDFIFMDCEPEAIIPGEVRLTTKGRERLTYVKERLGIN